MRESWHDLGYHIPCDTGSSQAFKENTIFMFTLFMLMLRVCRKPSKKTFLCSPDDSSLFSVFVGSVVARTHVRERRPEIH